jgi:hypothetical protein
MGFLIRTCFWFSLVLLFLPIGPEEGGETVSPLEALLAARDAIGDVSGMCEREPQVCETGRAALQTIGVRARESARIAYRFIEDDAAPVEEMPAAAVEIVAAPGSDAITTGGVTPAQ